MVSQKRSLLLTFLICICSLASFAQRAAYITVDNNNLPIDNLLMVDSVAGGRTFYSASFTINLTDDPVLQPFLNMLQVGIFKNSNVSFSITFTGAVNSIFLERSYRSANVLSVRANKLDARGRNVLKLEVMLRSSQMTEAASAQKKTNSGARPLMSHAFSVEIAGMPTARISAVSGLELKNNPLISLEVSSADIAEWNKWLATPAKKINGNIYLLAPNLRDRIKKFQLMNIEIVSISQNVVSDDNSISKFTVLLKPSMMLLDETK